MSNRKLGLNVGSGQRKFTSTPDIAWVNIDKVDRKEHHPDLLCDGSSIPLAAGIVDYFVLSQVYEHFGCGEALSLLREASRLLKDGGSLIISVPNMKALAERWVRGEISEYIFMVNTYGAYMGNEEDRHKWGTTPESLASDISNSADWKSISSFDGRSIPGMDVAMDWWITCLEAIK